MLQAIAIHHARAEHVDDFLAFMHRVIDVTEEWSAAPDELFTMTGA